MKNLIGVFLLLLSFVTVSFAEIGPVNRSTNLENDGSIKSGTLEKRFINVINGSGSDMTVGTLAVWSSSADDGATVTTSTSATATPACVIVGSASGSSSTCSSAKLCKCQVYGISEVRFGVFAGSAAAGGPVYISRDRAGYVEATPGGSLQASSQKIGMFYDAEAATNETAQVMLRL